MDTLTTPEIVAFLQKDAGWGPWIKVTVADTPEADAAAAAFFERASVYPRPDGEKYHVYEAHEDSAPLGQAMTELFFPTCEHGMSAQLCSGPQHFMSYEQERAMGW
jgi:hypothetical protein